MSAFLYLVTTLLSFVHYGTIWVAKIDVGRRGVGTSISPSTKYKQKHTYKYKHKHTHKQKHKCMHELRP